MSNVINFDFNDKQVRVVELDGNPWFVAKDVFDVLGYPKGSRSYQLNQLGDDEKGVLKIQTLRRMHDLRSLSESGLYKLIMRSDKPEAKKFQDWVTRDVLPAIRKDGAYIMDEEKCKVARTDLGLPRVNWFELVRTSTYPSLLPSLFVTPKI